MNLNKVVKIVEKPGQKFFDRLKILNKKPKTKKCNDPDCLISQNGGNCKTNEIVYFIKCKDCGDVYIGETCRNGHSRGKEHVKNARSENAKEREKSVLLRHMKEKHEGKIVPFDKK